LILDNNAKLKLFYLTGFSFIVLNSLAIAFEFFWLPAIPLIALLAYTAIYRIDLVLFFIVFLVPISVGFEDIGFGFGISLPDEPLIIGLFLLVVFKFIIDGDYDFRIVRHPISIAIIINLAWILISSCTSEFPVVSFKFFLSRFWYIILFYFIAAILFKKIKNIKNYLWLYIIPLTFVIVFTLVKHSYDNFSQITSFEVMSPFYIAHGIYSAAISFFIPILICFVLFGRSIKSPQYIIAISAVLVLLFTVAIILSYARAAWLGLGAALVFGAFMIFNVRLKIIIGILGLLTAFVIANFSEISFQLYQNKQNSSEGIERHFESISNIRNDVSNLERINRWVSAYNMSMVKPIVGFGPGAFTFTYAPYQDPELNTEISTAFGDQGHAHSEYLNPLAESGWPGLISFLAIIYVTFNIGMKLVYKSKNTQVRVLAAGILMGLVTILAHGLLNAYSEQDKIAVIFWGAFSMICALDLYHNKDVENPEKEV